MNRHRVFVGSAVCAPLAVAAAVHAGAHTWDIFEVFSNSDGTVQYIVLKEANGTPNEVNIGGLSVTSLSSTFTFPSSLPAGSSANKSILLGTAAYAALPGAVAPDHLIAANFFDLNDDFLEYHIYDDFNYGPGDLPLNGKLALHRLGPGATNFGPGPNSPTNCAGQTGSIDACPSDYDGDGSTGINDFLFVIGSWGTPAGDINGDGDTGIFEFLSVIGNWGAC